MKSKCKYCRSEIDASSENCPKCGAEIEHLVFNNDVFDPTAGISFTNFVEQRCNINETKALLREWKDIFQFEPPADWVDINNSTITSNDGFKFRLSQYDPGLEIIIPCPKCGKSRSKYINNINDFRAIMMSVDENCTNCMYDESWHDSISQPKYDYGAKYSIKKRKKYLEICIISFLEFAFMIFTLAMIPDNGLQLVFLVLSAIVTTIQIGIRLE